MNLLARIIAIGSSFLCLGMPALPQQPVDLLPPYNLSVKNGSNMATWELPRRILLKQDFNSTVFPPTGWTRSSFGEGWKSDDSPPCYSYWVIPPNGSRFAFTNDDKAGFENNGSEDLLISPVLDLTVADSFRLSFDSFLTGAFSHKASLEYRISDDSAWHELYRPVAHLEWTSFELDLSAFSGENGREFFQIAFHSDDNGLQGSGWAIDDIQVYNCLHSSHPVDFIIFYDESLIDSTTAQFFELPFSYYGEAHECAVSARYLQGNSDTSVCYFTSHYLQPPTGLRIYDTTAYDIGMVFTQPYYPSGYEPEDPNPTPGVVNYYFYDRDSVISVLDPWPQYVSFGLEEGIPASHDFYISALYNLAEFGFPEEYVESERDGPVEFSTLPFNAVHELDFEEEWFSESFQTNDWETTGSRWQLNSGLGHPVPAATFRGNPDIGLYDQSLVSPWIHAGIADSCELLLTYEINLYDNTPTGLQTLDVDVYDTEQLLWKTLKTYHNEAGMGLWDCDSLFLTRYAHDDLVKFRFRAYGDHSSDVTFWILDNILVSRYCYPPQALQAELNLSQDSVAISWENIYRQKERWIHWDDSIPYTAVGFGMGPEMLFDAAVRWDSAFLQDFFQYELTRLAIFVPEDEASYTFRVWSGDSAGTLLASRVCPDPVIGGWNLVDLAPPVTIDINEDLWIGFTCSSRGGYPLSVDNGPAVDHFGNMLRFGDSWISLKELDPGLNVNFNFQALLSNPGKEVAAFQVYRSVGGGPFVHFATTSGTSVTDDVTVQNVPVCYKARTVCYNMPELILVSGPSDTSCVVPVIIKDMQDGPSFLRVYPNPAQDMLRIISENPVRRVILFDCTGRQVFMLEPGTTEFTFSLESCRPGIYLLRSEVDSRSYYDKIIVQ